MSELAWSKEKDAETSGLHSVPEISMAPEAQSAALGAKDSTDNDAADVAPTKADEVIANAEDGITVILQPKAEPAQAAPADAPSLDPEVGEVSEPAPDLFAGEPMFSSEAPAAEPAGGEAVSGPDAAMPESFARGEDEAENRELAGDLAAGAPPQSLSDDAEQAIDQSENGAGQPQPSLVVELDVAPAAEAPPAQASSPDDAKITLLAPHVPASGWFAVEADGIIRGWTLDRAHPTRKLAVTIWIDDLIIGTALADRAHQRLIERGEGDGHYAFAFAVPPRFRDGAVHTVAAAISTEGYEGKKLKINKADFSFPAESELPRFLLQRVTPDVMEGTLVNGHPDWVGALDVWLDGERLSAKSVRIDRLGGDDNKASLRIRFADHRPLDLLSHSVVLSYPGVQEVLHEESAMQGLLKTEIKGIGEGRFAVMLGSGVTIPDGLEMMATLTDEQGQVVEHLAVRFYDNIGEFDFAGNEHEFLQLSLMTFDDIPLATNLPFTINSKRRLLINGTFEQWQESAPREWFPALRVDIERGFYAFPTNLKDQYGLSGKTLVLKLLPDSSEQVVLSQPVKRASRFGLTPTEVTVGFLARASRQLELEFRLVDDGGAVVASTRFITGSRWKLGSRGITVSRPNDTPSPLTFEVVTRFLSADDDIYLEIAGLRCGDLEEEAFDAPPPLRRSTALLRRDVNLLVNSDLHNWPSGLSFSDKRSRFEIAEGWYLFNRRATAATKASALSVPPAAGGMTRYGLSLDITAVPEYCRLEIALDVTEMYGAARLRFTASCNEVSEGPGSRFLFEKQWAQIDKIYVLKRETVSAGQKVAQVDSTIATVARRVLLARNWENLEYSFTLDAAEQAGEFEPVVVEEKLVEYFLVFEIRRPMLFGIHSIDLQFVHSIEAAPAAPLLQLEDRNIRAQAAAIRGLESWISPAIARSGLIAPPLGGDSREPERWNWKRNALGTVDVGICVYNAADETLACLASLVGATSVPHTVRIINDGSDEDCRQRILHFIADKPWMKLIDNGENRGYTASANRAVMESDADWVILLNSDTIVSKGWIEGLLEVAASDPKIALVGPVSNAATYQSVPELYDGGGKWAINDLPEGWTPADVAAVVAEKSMRGFPQVPLLNGFCTLIRRSVFTEIGGLNEAAFPAGYGEENDMCVRAAKAGYRLCVADHIYVYHIKSASFGSARRLELAKAGDKQLRSMHHEIDFSAMGRRFMETSALAHLRHAVRQAYKGQKN